ncbi:MAG: hypothetical protein WCO75_04435 [Planctomycetota bacterium]
MPPACAVCTAPAAARSATIEPVRTEFAKVMELLFVSVVFMVGLVSVQKTAQRRRGYT